MIRVTRHVLPNGLRVVHRQDPSTVMAAVDVIYNVGSRDESRELTGVAHLFEHLMFGGSVNVPDFDGEVERAGGWNNAWTSNDYTNFYTVVPAVNVETAFRLESDRMLALSFNAKALEVQRNVVVEEFKTTCLNQPYGDLTHRLRELLYPTHPYGWPTIGIIPDHILNVTDSDVREWFYSHYAPNNAVLVVTGNVTAEHAVALAEKWFGPIPRREIAPRTYAPEKPITEARQMIVDGPVPQTEVVMAWHMPGRLHPDYKVCDLISDVLANGQSSRFYQRLFMGTDIFTEIDASILGSEEPGLFLIQGRLRENGEEQERRAIEAVTEQLHLLMTEGPTPHEMERAANKFESTLTLGNLSYLTQALNLAEAEIAGIDPDRLVADYRSVTPDDVRRVATDLLAPSKCGTLIYRPR